MNQRAIPSYAIDDYQQTALTEKGFYISTLREIMEAYGDRRKPHIHDFYQVFLTHGRGIFMHDFVEHRLTRPTVAFASPGQVHAMPAREGFDGQIVSFTQAFFDDVLPPPSRLLNFPFFSSTGASHLPLRPANHAMLQGLFAEMRREFDQAQQGAENIVRAYLVIALTQIERCYRAAHPQPKVSAAAHLHDAFRALVEHRFREFLSLADYAAELHVTVNHLNDTMREQSRQSAGEFIRQRRLLDAKRLLLHSDLSISEIGYALGFKDASYFSRFFRRYTAQAPADFRVSIREKYQRNPA